MTPLVRPFLDKGFQVVALDAPAHGKSRGGRRICWCTGMLSRLLESYQPAAIVAHSFGAAASLLALEERASLQPRLVLLSATNDAAQSVAKMGQVLGLAGAAASSLQNGLARRVGRPLHEFIASNTGRTRRAPTLVIHDEGDVLVPVSEGRALAASLADGTFVATRGLGHNKLLFVMPQRLNASFLLWRCPSETLMAHRLKNREQSESVERSFFGRQRATPRDIAAE